MTQIPSRLRAVGVLGTAPLVAVLAPAPSTSWAALSDGRHPAAPLVGLVALAAWACTTWLTLLVALVWGARVPGLTGRAAARCAARVAPASVRALVRVALGTTVALSVAGGSSAFAAPQPTPAATSSYEWPGAAAQPAPVAPRAAVQHPHAITRLARLAPTHLPSQAPARRPGPSPADRHSAHRDSGGTVVERGDSLWAIAARSLGPEATPAQVAAAWPQWWQANRAVIGDHPDLIHPGDQLAAPSR